MSQRAQTQLMRPRIPPPILMLLAAGLMWVLDHWMPLAQWIAPPLNLLGALVVVAGIAIDVAAFVRFRNAETTVNPLYPSKASRLVTDGVFRVSRNPMYLGLLLLLIGWGIWLGSASPWLVPPLFVIVLTVVQIIPEEQALSRNFGEEYVSYRRSVARWIGRHR
jgi:protein-S-isoprenylcysteine O-methyltransferase Ste14